MASPCHLRGHDGWRHARLGLFRSLAVLSTCSCLSSTSRLAQTLQLSRDISHTPMKAQPVLRITALAWLDMHNLQAQALAMGCKDTHSPYCTIFQVSGTLAVELAAKGFL